MLNRVTRLIVLINVFSNTDIGYCTHSGVGGYTVKAYGSVVVQRGNLKVLQNGKS